MNMTFDSDKLDYSENCPRFLESLQEASFDLWNPDTGEYNAFANPKKFYHSFKRNVLGQILVQGTASIKNSLRNLLKI